GDETFLRRIERREMSDEQIKVPVPVVVEEGCGGRPVRRRARRWIRAYARFGRRIDKGSVGLTEEQSIRPAIVGQIDIGQAVVIDVADGNAAVKAVSRKSGRIRDFG